MCHRDVIPGVTFAVNTYINDNYRAMYEVLKLFVAIDLGFFFLLSTRIVF